MILRLLLSLILAGAPTASADTDDPPPFGQPEHFSGAVGVFRIEVQAEPAEVQVEDTLTYTVRILAVGPHRKPPRRPSLKDIPSFKDSFYLENLDPLDGALPEAQTWEYRYRLKPKSIEVRAIPGWPFSYYKPGALPARLGYRTIYASEIPLVVKERSTGDGTLSAGRPFDVPEATFQLTAAGRGEEDDRQRLPSWAMLVGLFGVPPLGCLVAYVAWRVRTPRELRERAKRRSRAANEALAFLERQTQGDPQTRAGEVALCVTRYLRHRWNLPTEQPTPTDVQRHLLQQGLSEDLVARGKEVLRVCDAIRFGPKEEIAPDVAALASGLIHSLEEVPC